MRLEGLRILTLKYTALVALAKRRMPTPLERRDIAQLERSLSELEAMAPAGDLSPAREIAKGF